MVNKKKTYPLSVLLSKNATSSISGRVARSVIGAPGSITVIAIMDTSLILMFLI